MKIIKVFEVFLSSLGKDKLGEFILFSTIKRISLYFTSSRSSNALDIRFQNFFVVFVFDALFND